MGLALLGILGEQEDRLATLSQAARRCRIPERQKVLCSTPWPGPTFRSRVSMRTPPHARATCSMRAVLGGTDRME